MNNLLTVIIVGILAGWLAGKIHKGRGFGLVGDLVVGVLGSVFGSWLFWQLGFAAYSFLGNVVVAVIGALVILWLVGIIVKR
jgi:uncharacterized membrane protein YeaQ/YmgE (transglycosylase-associated protein family)